MKLSDLCTEHRNALIEALEKLNAAFAKRSQGKTDEFAETIKLRWKPFMSECIYSLKKNKGVSCKSVFDNEKIGKKFMKLFCFKISRSNVCNDLIVLLHSFRCIDTFYVLKDYWYRCEMKPEDSEDILKCIDKCLKEFFSAFNDVNSVIKTALILPIGHNFELVSSNGRCRVFSRKKCECFIKPYQNIVGVFLRAYDMFIEIAKEKSFIVVSDEL